MKQRLLFLTIILIIFNEKLISQSSINRYNYRHEIFLTGRIGKDLNYVLPSIGYEFSFNKTKTYLSLATEFLSALSLYKYNISDQLMSTFKVNYQGRYITSLGVGLKQNFNVKHTNFVAIGSYKQDIFKHKLTFSANILFELDKPIRTPLGAGSAVCVKNCPKYFYVWRLGFAVGKYF